MGSMTNFETHSNSFLLKMKNKVINRDVYARRAEIKTNVDDSSQGDILKRKREVYSSINTS